MSHDLYLEIDTGGEYPTVVADVGNYTSNVSGMWAKALGERLREFHGRNAGESVPQLDRGIADMQANRLDYEAMNPPNGWGSYGGALDYLRTLRDCCARHPKTTIRVSC